MGKLLASSQMGRPEARRAGTPVGVSLDLQLQERWSKCAAELGFCLLTLWGQQMETHSFQPAGSQSVSQPWMLHHVRDVEGGLHGEKDKYNVMSGSG